MKENKFFLKLLFLGAFILTVAFAYPAFKEMGRKKKIEAEISHLEQERNRLKRDSSLLEDKIAYFETPEYKERVSKERLNMQKDGEKVIYVKPEADSLKNNLSDAQSKNEQSVLGERTKADDMSNYKKWWKYFFEY